MSVQFGRVIGSNHQSLTLDEHSVIAQKGRAAKASGVRTSTRPVGRSRTSSRCCRHQPAAVEDADASTHLLDLGK